MLELIKRLLKILTLNYGVKQVEFFARLPTVGIGIWHGPIIQTANKVKYFENHAKNLRVNVSFHDGKDSEVASIAKRARWNHFLFPSDCTEDFWNHKNFSVGPNIPLAPIFGPAHPKFERQILSDRWIVADSDWNKEALLECFPEIDEKRICVIPIYIGQQFHDESMSPNEKFTIGFVGYSDDKLGIKNVDSMLSLAKRRPEWNFELIANRDSVPEYYARIQNLKVFLEVSNAQMPKIMRKWSCYLGLSKRERGPATIQEANALGCPTVCANHTGYACFKPLVPLELPPFSALDENHLKYIDRTLADVSNNHIDYLNMADRARRSFWSTQTPEHITHKWKAFFLKCLGDTGGTSEYRK